MIKLLIATHNIKKRLELKELLKECGNVKVISWDDVEIDPPIIVEDGKTFRQNAVKKAVTVSRFFDELVMSDDSGLEVDSLHGKPGIRSARFARKHATDAENNKKLLKLLNKVPGKDRSARFVSCIALAREGMLLDTFEGIVKGEVALKPRGRNGFGYDPLFIPKGYSLTFAEMPAEDKNQISHRAIALKKLKEYLTCKIKTHSAEKQADFFI